MHATEKLILQQYRGLTVRHAIAVAENGKAIRPGTSAHIVRNIKRWRVERQRERERATQRN